MAEQNQKVAVHGLIINGDKFLITKRSALNDFKPGEWDIPGGSVEFGEEDCEAALNREIAEETGLKVKVGKLLHLYSFLSGPERHQFQFIYECIYAGGDVVLNPGEHDEYKWVTPEEMSGFPLIAFLRDLYEKVLIKQLD